MTEEEQRILEKWKRRAMLFRKAYREASMEVTDLRWAIELKTLLLNEKVEKIENLERQLKARLN